MRRFVIRSVFLAGIAVVLFVLGKGNGLHAATAPAPGDRGVVLLKGGVGDVEVWPKGAARPVQAAFRPEQPQPLYPGDRLLTGRGSHAVIQLTDGTTTEVGPQSILEVQEPRRTRSALSLIRGLFFFFHRDEASDLEIQVRQVSAAIRGTEFVFEVRDDGTVDLSLVQGEMTLSDASLPGLPLDLRGPQAASWAPGQSVRPKALLDPTQAVQWFLYYPAVLDPDELDLPPHLEAELSDSLDAYRAGALFEALQRYPRDRPTEDLSDQVYLAALLLATGELDQGRNLILSSKARLAEAVSGDRPIEAPRQERLLALVTALETLVAAVQGRERPDGPGLTLATEWLAESYYLQSRHLQSRRSLEAATAAARQATLVSPNFGFGWARVAELEFSRGDRRRARQALERSLELSPRNAQAHTVLGFVAASENRVRRAAEHFGEAIALDSSLANGWLGRGLCRIHQGELEDGLLDLQMAATVEPNRALLRSYLGKAFAEVNRDTRAFEELDLAVGLDEQDPTPWLYSAILKQRQNRINEALADLDKSVERNDNRWVYRSQLLLDQDRAVRGANLANVYRDLGLTSISLTEAARAVAANPAGAEGHRFLAGSYDALRDPRQVNLRYETVWLNHWLLANLLGPVGSGSISTFVSQQEYTGLFERDRARLYSRAETRTDGERRVDGSAYGTFGRTSYSLDAAYFAQDGTRPNEDLEMLALSVQLKQQVTAQDAVFIQVYGYDLESGDVQQFWDPAQAQPNLRFSERQEPAAFVGYHREWSPGQNTLFLGGILDSRITLQHVEDYDVDRVYWRDDGTATVRAMPYELADYSSDLTVYNAELQHLWQTHPHTFIFGGRIQSGTTRTESALIWTDIFGRPTNLLQTAEADLGRLSAYAYYHLQVAEPLLLIAGVSYERVTYPINIDKPPIAEGETSKDQVSPKLGLIWTPEPGTVVRGAYTRSLGGVYHDTSVRLEPTQVAGFVQTFRSAIPESVAGSVPGSRFETAGLGVTQRLGRSTFLDVTGEHLGSDGSQGLGIMWSTDSDYGSATVAKELQFKENSLQASVHQLLGNAWVAGVSYRISRAKLDQDQPGLALPAARDYSGATEATLQQIGLSLRLNLSSGWFALAESLWIQQDWEESSPTRTSTGTDRLWQHNLLVGYRFAQRRAELTLGVLNVTDEDYRLHPLNLYPNYPRSRVLAVSGKVDF